MKSTLIKIVGIVLTLVASMAYASDLDDLQLSADQGDLDAQLELARIYATGSSSVARNVRVAMDYYQLAAEQGSHSAQVALGNLYFNGVSIPQNYLQAYGWYRLAAHDGWMNGAQFRLGYLYANGLGVTKDLIRAYVWFSVASAQGDTTASDRQDRYERLLTTEKLNKAQEIATRCFNSVFVDCE